jgi:hypothetical protein
MSSGKDDRSALDGWRDGRNPNRLRDKVRANPIATTLDAKEAEVGTVVPHFWL